jgi:hypothetical protein
MQNLRMKKSTNGHGILSVNGDIMELRMMGATACAMEDKGTHMVRIVIMGKIPGSPQLEVKLSAEDAATFASKIYGLARSAIIMNERETADTSAAPALQAVAA